MQWHDFGAVSFWNIGTEKHCVVFFWIKRGGDGFFAHDFLQRAGSMSIGRSGPRITQSSTGVWPGWVFYAAMRLIIKTLGPRKVPRASDEILYV